MSPDNPAQSDHYRRERAPCSRELIVELSRISDEIADPVAKLRYLQRAADWREPALARRLPRPMRRALYRLHGLRARDAHRHERDSAGAGGALGARARTRRLAAAAGAAALLILPALLAGLALRSEPKSSEATAAAMPGDAGASPDGRRPGLAPAASGGPVAEPLPREIPGQTPAAIWLADRGEHWELYSNGLRIETEYAVRGEPRRFRSHDRHRGLLSEVHTRPVGVLYHTSESDLLPLEEEFAARLRRSSAALLRYLRDQRSYNYLIDRFGRVYRLVDDESRAQHAGRGVWARHDEVYLDLNGAFLGVSFESRWEGGRTLPITRAQLLAGRNLTHYLRQRFAIAPEMCVAHGITSVNARQGLIGYHRDWARGFPFEAFGLPDQYAAPTPSVALFGFRYDRHFLLSIGEPWPGLIAAERLLAEEARERAVDFGALRRERQALYMQWSREALYGASDDPSTQSTIEDQRG